MSQYVIDDRETPRFRVNREAMISADVLALERERIFDRSWLYVGHETELKKPHDFRARSVGGRPVIFARDADGEVRVFINSCTHRGALLCREREGNGRFLKCFYHAWSFDTSGRLVAMPDDDSYGPTFDRANLALAQPPRIESYRGFVFLSYDPDIVDLVTYLAGARDYLDLICDQSETGMEIIGGTHEYSMRANWKLLVENSIDGYHAMPTHQRYMEMLVNSGTDVLSKFRRAASDDGSMRRRGPSGGFDLGNGHAVVGGPGEFGRTVGSLGRDWSSEEVWQEYLARQERFRDIYGDEWASRLYGGRNLLIFPNLLLVDAVMGVVVRTLWPTSPDYIEITAWQISASEESPQMRKERLSSYLTFWGPGGLATPDDVEALESCQRGFAAVKELPWNDISRGMVRDQPTGMDELQMRVFWRRWNALITGEELPPESETSYQPTPRRHIEPRTGEPARA